MVDITLQVDVVLVVVIAPLVLEQDRMVQHIHILVIAIQDIVHLVLVKLDKRVIIVLQKMLKAVHGMHIKQQLIKLLN